MTTPAEGIAALERAFGSVPRPTNEELLHPRCADDSDLKGLYAFERWRDVPDAVIEREYAALAFLSAAGYRCFLPAYLRFALRHSHGGAAAVDSTVWSLLPEMYEGDLIEFARSKYELLTRAERDAIGVALEALAADGHPDAAKALASWRSSGGSPHVPR
ncbi:MAG TPA: DUF6714 family protein [Actinomycetota bacterium]